MTIATVGFVVAMAVIGFQGFPRSVIAIDWVASIMLVGGLRLGLRMAREVFTPGPPEEGRRRVLIIGAGDAGVGDFVPRYQVDEVIVAKSRHPSNGLCFTSPCDNNSLIS